MHAAASTLVKGNNFYKGLNALFFMIGRLVEKSGSREWSYSIDIGGAKRVGNTLGFFGRWLVGGSTKFPGTRVCEGDMDISAALLSQNGIYQGPTGFPSSWKGDKFYKEGTSLFGGGNVVVADSRKYINHSGTSLYLPRDAAQELVDSRPERIMTIIVAGAENRDKVLEIADKLMLPAAA